MVFVIGLTGGIGSGKSTVAHYFSELDVPVIDADNLSRELCATNNAVEKIKERFGKIILDASGEISRKKLREIIFENSNERRWLEDYLHPLIIDAILNWVKNLSSDYCVIAAPLLFETDLKNYVDRILVVDAPKETQIERVIIRDKTQKQEVEKVLITQLSSEYRLKLADDVIFNNAGFDLLRDEVLKLNTFYSELARQNKK